jgi:hypothetical protein
MTGYNKKPGHGQHSPLPTVRVNCLCKFRSRENLIVKCHTGFKSQGVIQPKYSPHLERLYSLRAVAFCVPGQHQIETINRSRKENFQLSIKGVLSSPGMR